MVGLSRQPKDLSVMLFEELCRRGYDVVPVNPGAAEVMGRPCFARVQDIKPPVDGVLLMTSPTATEAVVGDSAEAGIRRVWMYSAGSQGAVSPKAVEFCWGERDSGRAGASVPSCFFRITDSTGFTGSFAKLPRVVRAGAMHSLDESSTKSPAQAELGPGTQYPQKIRYPQEKILMNPVAVRSGDRNCASCPAPRARASAARYPLRTAPSMVAGQPVAVQSPARKTRGQGVTGPGRYASIPGRGE